MTTEPRIRIIDIEELTSWKLKPQKPTSSERSYCIGHNECIDFIIEKLSSPDKTKEIIKEAFEAGENWEYGSNFSMVPNPTPSCDEFINSLIKD